MHSLPKFLAALAALWLAACLGPAGGSTEAEGVRLQGRVIGTSGTPVPGVVVTAARTGLADTTDALGRYVLSAKTADTTQHDVVLDTLRFRKNGQSLAKVTVTQWIEELPDVEVVQRNISGSLNMGMVPMSKIEFVLTGDGIDSSAPVVTPMYYNALAGNYSGFAYFPPTPDVANYAVHVNVYGAGGVLLGRSATVPFNSFAGDITIPWFSPTNAYPTAKAGSHRTVNVGDTVHLSGTASDAFGGSIAKWEWSIDGGPFRQTASGDTVITAPSVRTATYSCVLRVTDNEGNTDVDALNLQVLNDSPVISGLADTLVVGLNASVTFNATATDAHGVARYLWDFDGNGTVDDTTTTGSVTRVFPDTAGMSNVLLTVQDPYDGVSRDSVKVFRLTVGKEWAVRSSGVSASLLGVASAGGQFVAVGRKGAILTSPDGATWTSRSLADTNRTFSGVAHTGSRFVALANYRGTSYDSSIFLSTHGIDWTPRMDTTLRGRPIDKVVWLGGRVIAYGSSAMVSSDGDFWKPAPVGVSYSDGRTLSWNGTQYLVLQTNTRAMVSNDGFTWTPVTITGLPASGSVLIGLTWVGDRYVVSTGAQIYHSLDGVVWTLASRSRINGRISAMTWTGSTLVAVILSGQVLISPDKGLNWVTKTTAAGLREAAWNGTRLVIVGDNGLVLTSD